MATGCRVTRATFQCSAVRAIHKAQVCRAMASEVVCYHIKAVVSEALSSSNRGLKLKQLGNTILEKI